MLSFSMQHTNKAASIGTLRTSTVTLRRSLASGRFTFEVIGEDSCTIICRFKRTGKRQDIFLATKFGYSPQGARGDPAYVKEQCYKSLERLGVDCIDLYYLHRYVQFLYAHPTPSSNIAASG